MIDEGLALVDRALMMRRPGLYQVQRRSWRYTHGRLGPRTRTGPRSPALFEALERMTPTPVVRLNRAVAIAMADGPERGLPLVDALSDDLDGYHLFHAA